MTIPMQFDFQREWNTSVRSIRDNEQVDEALERTFDFHYELAEFIHEEHKDVEPMQAAAELALAHHTFEVKRWCLDWHRENSEDPFQLIMWSLAIAEALFPDEKWDCLENRQFDYYAVANESRTMVFDMKNFDRFSAGTSLYLAGDTKYRPSLNELEAGVRYLEEKGAAMQRVMENIEKAREFLKNEGKNVVPLKG